MYACLQVDTGFYYSLNTIYVRIPRYQSKFRAVAQSAVGASRSQDRRSPRGAIASMGLLNCFKVAVCESDVGTKTALYIAHWQSASEDIL